jgi:hypothetical protein
MTVQSSTFLFSVPFNINPRSTWDWYASGSAPFPAGQSNPTPPNHLVVPGANWDWDGASPPYFYPWMFWRKWIIIQSYGSQAPWTAPTATWASGGTYVSSIVANATYGTVYANGGTPGSSSSTSFNWGNGKTCWGWSGTAQQASGLQQIALTCKSAGVWVPWIIVNYNSSYFQQTGVVGTDMPDGTWGYAAKIVSNATYGTVYQNSRPSCSVCSLLAGTADGQGTQPLGVG